MFGEALHTIVHEQQSMTLQEIADVWGLSPKSVYHYMDAAHPTLDKVLLLLRVAPPQAQEVLLQLISRYAPEWAVTRLTAADLDINKDGQIDMADLLAAAVRKVDQTSATLTATHRMIANGGGCISEADATHLDQVAQEGIQLLMAYRKIVATMSRRRPTMPSKMGGVA